LTREEAIAVEPCLEGNNDLVGAVLKPQCCTMDPFLLCNAFYERAKSSGVRFVFGKNVTNMKKLSSRISLSSSPPPQPSTSFPITIQPTSEFILSFEDGSEISADMVLLCAGHHDASLSKLLGHDVPVKGMHGQMFAAHLPPSSPPLRHMIFSYEGPYYWQMNRDRGNSTLDVTNLARRCHHIYGLALEGSNGVVKFGGDRVIGDRNGVVIEKGLQETYERVEQLFPQYKGMERIGEGWGGTMPFTPDQNVIIGKLEEGVYVCTGAPFTKGAASGFLLAESVVNGEKSQYVKYLIQASPLRFGKKE
jgi:glycine/D-amino acid oxidase-like deaminating enzyme